MKFNEHSFVSQICAVLYEERLNPDYKKILFDSGYGCVLSPLHTPDDEEKKPHRHLIIKDMHGNTLSYYRVEKLLESLNENHAFALELANGQSGVKSYAKYMLHITKDSRDKQQFDLTKHSSFQNYPEDGIINGLLNIYHPTKGYFDCGGLHFENLIVKTIREQADEISEERKKQLGEILNHIYSTCACNFADVALWCQKNGLLDALIAYNAIIRPILQDMSSSQHFSYVSRSNDDDYRNMLIEEKKDIEYCQQELRHRDNDCSVLENKKRLDYYKQAFTTRLRALLQGVTIVYSVSEFNDFTLYFYEFYDYSDDKLIYRFKDYITDKVGFLLEYDYPYVY